VVNEVQLNAAADGIEETVASAMVGIVCGSGDQKWRGIGTGTLIRWKEQHLILTAEHVIAGTLVEDLRFFFRQDAPLIRRERSALLELPGMPAAALRPFREIELGRSVSDAKLDLAALPVDGGMESKYPVRFFTLEPGGTTPGVDHTTIVMGFPHDISRVTKKNERVVFTYVEWTQVAPSRTGLEDFEDSNHFLASYRLTESYPDADPHGLSGSAMWFRRGDTPLVWHPNIDIAGVTIAWYRRPSLLKMVRREPIECFLTDQLG